MILTEYWTSRKKLSSINIKGCLLIGKRRQAIYTVYTCSKYRLISKAKQIKYRELLLRSCAAKFDFVVSIPSA